MNIIFNLLIIYTRNQMVKYKLLHILSNVDHTHLICPPVYSQSLLFLYYKKVHTLPPNFNTPPHPHPILKNVNYNEIFCCWNDNNSQGREILSSLTFQNTSFSMFRYNIENKSCLAILIRNSFYDAFLWHILCICAS